MNDNASIAKLQLVREEEVEFDIVNNQVEIFNSMIATYTSAFDGRHPAIDDLKNLFKDEEPEGAPREKKWEKDGSLILDFQTNQGKSKSLGPPKFSVPRAIRRTDSISDCLNRHGVFTTRNERSMGNCVQRSRRPS